MNQWVIWQDQMWAVSLWEEPDYRVGESHMNQWVTRQDGMWAVSLGEEPKIDENPNNPANTKANDLNTHFSKEALQMINTQEKKNPFNIITIRENAYLSKSKCCLIQVKMAVIN